MILKMRIKGFLDKYGEIIGLILITLVAGAMRGAVFSATDDFHGISAGRVLQAELFLRNKYDFYNFYNSVFPPAHLLIIILALKIFHFPLIAPRITSLFFGVLTIPFFYYYIKNIFESRKVAFFSILALALYPLHVVYSVIATSEAMFNFFLIAALCHFVLFFKKRNNIFLMSSAVLISFASLSRYEGLIFIPLMAVLLRKDFRAMFGFLLLSTILPFLWMYINYKYGGYAFKFLTDNNFIVPLQFNWIRSLGIDIDFVFKLLFWPKVLMDTLGVPVFVLGICGISYALIKRQSIKVAVIFFIFLSIFICGTIQEKLYLQRRYGIMLGIMLLPFSIYMALTLTKKLKPRIQNIIIVTLLLLSFVPAFTFCIDEDVLYAPYFAKKVAKYLKDNMKDDDFIIMDHCGDEKFREPIKLLSGINPVQFVLPPFIIDKYGMMGIDENRFFDFMNKYDVTYILYSPKGDFSKFLALKPAKAQALINGYYFYFKYINGPYQLYQVKKEHNENKNL
ncbi:MAG: glycosyltransferase family 39 protein [Candidatus Omnitrophota bacterium]